jgi:hypothetical protein
MKRFVSPILIVFACVCTGVGAYLLVSPESGVIESRPGTRAVEEELSDLRVLRSKEYRYTEVVYYVEESRVLGLRTGLREVLFSVDIVVQAGVDLAAGFSVEVADESDLPAVYVTLPAAEILLVDAEEDSIEQYFSAELFGRLDLLEIGDELARAKDRNRSDAIERGILDAAERRARVIVTNLFRSSGFQQIEVRFRPAAELRG